jgi:hypothetical protein
MHRTKSLSTRSSCWRLQVSLSVQRRLGPWFTASTWRIRPVAWRGPASCSGLVQWRALRSVITPVAMQMAASIALGCGGKASASGAARSAAGVCCYLRYGGGGVKITATRHRRPTRLVRASRRGDLVVTDKCPLLALSGQPALHRTRPLLGGRADMAFCTAMTQSGHQLIPASAGNSFHPN